MIVWFQSISEYDEVCILSRGYEKTVIQQWKRKLFIFLELFKKYQKPLSVSAFYNRTEENLLIWTF